eukprot:3938685-Pleurochrysis_carterae.AAC.1
MRETYPSALHVSPQETCRTMHYACSAGAIRVKPTVKLDPQQQLIARLRQEVLDLKQQARTASS